MTWPDTFVSRLKIWALIETLNAELLAADSATLTLDKWCRDHQLAPGAQILARRTDTEQKPLTPQQRNDLRIGTEEPVAYRRVALHCGDLVLSEAENWYVPSRLTPAMNEALEQTDSAFGRVVRPLAPQRHTFSARILWHPLPDGWEMAMPENPVQAAPRPADPPVPPLEIPAHLLEHRALLSTSEHQPFSLVIETYTSGILSFRSR
ncbi:hypothetical protein [Beijerinckia indica]|uniref:hypothetical protein n=1 Tax=Beijerinckia indica TaxID=533 RepID=UPI0002D5FB00|nr:hypothetical protein [Beijerinckia indica]